MENFSQRIKNVLAYSKEEAERLGNKDVGIPHLYLGILRDAGGEAFEYLKDANVDVGETRKLIEDKIKKNNSVQLAEKYIPFDYNANRVLKFVYLEARSLKNTTIDTEHLLLAILKDDTSFVTQILMRYGIDYHAMKKHVSMSAGGDAEDEMQEDEDISSEKSKNRAITIQATKTKTPVLDNFGIDITKAAEDGVLDPIVGRQEEIERLVQILGRRKKNNPILIGEPGVGKSAIAEGLASRIVEKKVSRVLFGKRLVTLDLASIVAGTKYRGQFEERMKSIISELQKNDDVILFIDEIHTLVGAGGSTGSLDAANMLKPALARGEIQCVGATTLDEYRQHIEKDGALERRFQKVLVEPTSIEQSIEILQNIKEKYEDYHNVAYTDDALEACVKLTDRYLSERNLPDKAIDALDEAGSRVHISSISIPPALEKLENNLTEIIVKKRQAVQYQDFELAASFRDKERSIAMAIEKEKKLWDSEMKKHREIVDENKIAEVIAMMTGVPVKRIAAEEGLRLKNMEDDLRCEVIGQNEAIEKIVKSIKRNRAGLKDPARPIGSFIFLGPTGVGKTQLAKVLSEYLFDSKDALVRIDMSEYMEKFSVSRLVGAPPGYVGYEEGGQLTEKVRRKPYSVVLLDEIEKAHPDIFNILLQILDDGQITDSLGRRVDFKNTLIIMTSNIGSRQLKDFGRGIGFDTPNGQSDSEHTKGVIQKALKKAFAPEFLNRVDDIVLFEHLSKDDIQKIVDIELLKVYQRLENLGYKATVTDKAKSFLADKGYDKEYGARPLKRVIRQYVEEELSEFIINDELQKNDVIILDVNDDNTAISVEKEPHEQY